MKSHCDVGAHQPVREYEYRVIYYLSSANEPRWIATYHNALDSALDQLDGRRAAGDTSARLQECVWRDSPTVDFDPMAGVTDDDDSRVQWPAKFVRWCRVGAI